MGVASHVLVLNHDGRGWLEACLPSVVLAAGRASGGCRVSVVDNASTDDSLAYLESRWPGVGRISEPNRGLASFNAVLGRVSEPTCLLLNNDVKLDPGAIDPLVAALDRDDALFSAPCCWTFDGLTYEGMRTRVRSRFGMVQGLCRVPGHEAEVGRPDLTASAGPVLAVRRGRFLEVGGYDPIFLPGRLEDLDLGFRGWMAGYRGYYVPESVAYHHGFGSFGPAFGAGGCDRLAARNTLLFAWKNLSGARLLGHLAWLPVRLAHSLATRRWGFARALGEASARLGEVVERRRALGVGRDDWSSRQEAFFRRFAF